MDKITDGQWAVGWNGPSSVTVGPWPSSDNWPHRYAHWWSFADRLQAEGVADPTAMTFVLFAQLIVDHGLDPAALHREFVKIDAYRAHVGG